MIARMNKPILILTSGTRGDVTPYLALGRGLMAAGLPVAIASHAEFRSLVEGSGVTYRELAENPTDLLKQPGSMPLTLGKNPIQNVRASLRFLQQARPWYVRLLESAWQACQGAGAVVVNLPTWWGASIGEALGVPVIWAPLQPLTRTRAFPTALQPIAGSAGPAYNLASHRVLEQLLWQPWRKQVNAWRNKTLHLPPYGWGGPFGQEGINHHKVVYGISPHVLPAPSDWPASHTLAGYWFWDEPDWQPPPALETFLSAGEVPVYIGFGSMEQTRQTLETAFRAVEQCGVRAVIAARSLPGSASSQRSNVYLISHAPHGWLFERVRAVIHHGGAGTTAAGLRAGKPTAITPVGVDQYFWGERTWKLGVGPKPVPQHRLNPWIAAEMIHTLVNDQGMAAQAGELGEKIRQENGVEKAVEIIRRQVG